MRFSKVDLPEPLLPTTPTMPEFKIFKLKFALKEPNEQVSLSILSISIQEPTW